MGLFKTLKYNAKRAMAGGWGRAIAIMLIMAIPPVLMSVLEFAIRMVGNVPAFLDASSGEVLDGLSNIAAVSSAITFGVSLLLFLVSAPLRQGACRWYYRRTDGEKEPVGVLFHYFETAKDYFRSLWMYFQIGLRMLLWSILLFAPLIVGAGLLGYYRFVYYREPLPGMVALAGGMLAVIWMVLGTVLLVFVQFRYFLAPYLLAAHPGMKARRAIKQGIKYVKGHKASLFGFHLSFLLWYLPLVAVLVMLLASPFVQPYAMRTLSLGMMALLAVQLMLAFYLTPYISASRAMYAHYLIHLSENGLPETEDEQTREYVAAPAADLGEPAAPEDAVPEAGQDSVTSQEMGQAGAAEEDT